MSYTNGTTHYNLPQTTGSDKRDWADANQAFADVDAALYGAVQDTAQAELDIDALETRMGTAELNIATNTGDISGLDTRVTTVEGAVTSLSGQVTDTRQDLEDMICAFNEASATSTHAYVVGDYFIYNDVLYRAIQAIAIGDTIVPDTNCTTTNVSTELLFTQSSIAFYEFGNTASREHAAGSYFYLNDLFVRAKTAIAIGDTFTNNVNYFNVQVGNELAELFNSKADKNIIYARATADGVKTWSALMLEIVGHITVADFDRYAFTLNLDNQFFFAEAYHDAANGIIELSYSDTTRLQNGDLLNFVIGMGTRKNSLNELEGYRIQYENVSTDNGVTIVPRFIDSSTEIPASGRFVELYAQFIPIIF